MSRRIKTPQSLGRDYKQMLKDYFGFHLQGLDIDEYGGQILLQVVYTDFKHIDTVRRELAQMMPEVEFTKLRRDYTQPACHWVLERIMLDELAPKENTPIVYVKQGDNIIRTSIREIAINELRQLELDEDDEKEICYDDNEKSMKDDEHLAMNW